MGEEERREKKSFCAYTVAVSEKLELMGAPPFR
jgi:hypothetical protein